jgi:hypothetical protein
MFDHIQFTTHVHGQLAALQRRVESAVPHLATDATAQQPLGGQVLKHTSTRVLHSCLHPHSAGTTHAMDAAAIAAANGQCAGFSAQ